jgi:hypothetical protein
MWMLVFLFGDIRISEDLIIYMVLSTFSHLFVKRENHLEFQSLCFPSNLKSQ